MGIKGLEHMGFVVVNPGGAAGWYREHLGFKVLRTAPDGTVAFIQCPETGLILELIGEGGLKAGAKDLTHPLQVHLAVRTDSFETDRDRLISAGAEFAMHCETDDPEAKVCVLKDPFGLYLQLAQRRESFWE